jgi:hypothetical protein
VTRTERGTTGDGPHISDDSEISDGPHMCDIRDISDDADISHDSDISEDSDIRLGYLSDDPGSVAGAGVDLCPRPAYQR